MAAHFDVFSFGPPSNPNPEKKNEVATDLLQQMLEVQKQMLAQLQATAQAQDAGARWRSLLARWHADFPQLPQACKRALPVLERAYGSILAALTEELEQHGDDGLDNEFVLQDFLDRYGMRLGQLGNILNLVGPLAEASSHKESP